MKQLPAYLASAFLIRLLITGASIGDSIALFSLAALYSFHLYVESQKEDPINEQVKNKLLKVEAELVEVKSGVSAMKLASGFKQR